MFALALFYEGTVIYSTLDTLLTNALYAIKSIINAKLFKICEFIMDIKTTPFGTKKRIVYFQYGQFEVFIIDSGTLSVDFLKSKIVPLLQYIRTISNNSIEIQLDEKIINRIEQTLLLIQ